jgi:hypothetical protein
LPERQKTPRTFHQISKEAAAKKGYVAQAKDSLWETAVAQASAKGVLPSWKPRCFMSEDERRVDVLWNS